jgi:rSAM/selenodomain-associated transferase 2
LLSVIIPCLNEAEGIADTLRSLAPLRARGVEVVVADGGSSDGTAELAQPLADAVISAPRGRAKQMDAGAKHARGEVLLFLHADCRLPDAADAVIIDGLNRARTTWGRFDVTLTGTHPLLRIVGAMMNMRSRLTGVATGDQGIFVTRSLFEASGGIPQIALMEDVALCKRLKQYAKPLCLRHCMTVSGRRWEKHGVLRTILLMWRLRLEFWLGADPDTIAPRYAAHKSDHKS